MILATKVERGDRGEDRLSVECRGDRTFIVVADGAGGMGAGGQAAEFFCGRVTDTIREATIDSPEQWATCLIDADRTLAASRLGGETTAVVVEISESPGWIRGASVGDSGAWLISMSGIVDLTQNQRRKPLLGSGTATPVEFGPVPMCGRILVATDGLFAYASTRDIATRALVESVDDAVSALVAGIRLRSGSLQDDVAVALGELAKGR